MKKGARKVRKLGGWMGSDLGLRVGKKSEEWFGLWLGLCYSDILTLRGGRFPLRRYEGEDAMTEIPTYPPLPRIPFGRDWALRAAKQDASFLISPTARRRALSILFADNSLEADAARVILQDGGAQQGESDLGGKLFVSGSMETWRDAADILGVFDGEGETS